MPSRISIPCCRDTGEQEIAVGLLKRMNGDLEMIVSRPAIVIITKGNKFPLRFSNPTIASCCRTSSRGIRVHREQPAQPHPQLRAQGGVHCASSSIRAVVDH
jgi:hypothetical protein